MPGKDEINNGILMQLFFYRTFNLEYFKIFLKYKTTNIN